MCQYDKIAVFDESEAAFVDLIQVCLVNEQAVIVLSN